MFFLNPFAMAVGGALISAPILIHLINRMRFKRIRWAAMEFLLKSQQRNRRRLIIEQLILLMLRCLLVLLAGFLVARFVGQALGGGAAATGVTHVIVIDDTLSMTDRAPKNQTPGPNCFEAAQKEVEALLQFSFNAPSKQTVAVMLLSNKEFFFEEELNVESYVRLGKLLTNLKPTFLAGDTAAALEHAKKKLSASLDSKKWLHLVSDFREQDWGRQSDNMPIHTTLDEIADAGTNIAMLDTAAPARDGSRGKGVDHHNNYAITDLRPEKRVAPAGIVALNMEVENFGNESKPSLFIQVFVNGVEDKFVTKYYEPAPSPGSKQRYKFEIMFDPPAEGQHSRFHRVSAVVKEVDSESGLLADNVRHTVVEVRKEVPTLIIDGSGDEGQKSGGDTRVIRDVLESVKGTEAVKVVVKPIEELLRPDLEREYATIYLLNMETLRSRDEKSPNLPAERLKEFVQKGGNVVFFTGDKINVDYYNQELYTKSKGLFPIPIEEQVSKRMTEEEIAKRRASGAPKIFVLEKEHDLTRGVFDVQYKIPDLIIPRHTPAKERFEWKNEWTKDGDIKELITLAELKTINDTFAAQTQRLLNELPVKDNQFERYHGLLEKHVKLVKQAILESKSDEAYKVAEAIDFLLNDKGDKPNQKDNIAITDFWQMPEMEGLKSDFVKFRRDILYGKPLVVSRKYGQGNVVAFMTTAGTKWSGWSGGLEGGVASFTFPMVIADLQKFLTRGGDGGSRAPGQSVHFALDPKQYKGDVKIYQLKDADQADPGRKPEGDAPLGFDAPIEKSAVAKNNDVPSIDFTFNTPGTHFVKLFPQGKDPEEHWFSFNVDTASESNLRRVPIEEVVRNPSDAKPTRGKITMGGLAALSEKLSEKKSDLSEMWWLFLIFILVLFAEQAMAVHLSFHVKGSEATTPGPMVAARTA